jgi:hypothetical protein
MKQKISAEINLETKPVKGFSKFCSETSLPGWSYLNHRMNQFWKIIWIIFLCFVVANSIYVVQINTESYLKAKTITTIESTIASLKDITFPAIYICNINQVKTN